MVTVEDLINNLKENYKPNEVLAVAIWSKGDITQAAKEKRLTLTDDQIDMILDDIDRHQDASMGISWETVKFFFFRRKPIIQHKC